MAVNLIFQRVSNLISKHWRLDGFDTQKAPSIWVSPVLPGRVLSPPYLIACKLAPESTYAKILITASDYKNSNVSEAEIEEIATDVIRRLDSWSQDLDLHDVLMTTTIGSAFRLDDYVMKGTAGTWLAPNYELNRRYLPVSRLKRLWETQNFELPPLLDIEDLRSISRLHDSISLVRLPNGDAAIFKGAVRVIARMYHEIRELLRMPPHPNIMSKPWYLVTRHIPGMHEPALCGFVLEYHTGGSLLNRLSNCNPDQPIRMSTKIRWIRQILSAFQHIHNTADSFYSDLRLDNIVLDSNDDLTLVDFEQYGSSDRWFPPALWERKREPLLPDHPAWADSATNPAKMSKGIFYSNPPRGYLKQFVTSTDRERQGLEVYSMAKVFWCIFEELPNEYSLMDLTKEELGLRGDDGRLLSESIFPVFRKTPIRMRYWIWVCTRQSPEWGIKRCKCKGGDGYVCNLSAARQGIGSSDETDGSQMFPGIEATQHYFEGWVKDQAGTFAEVIDE